MVDRYDLGYHGPHQEDVYMAKDEDGEYVLYSDYEKLEKENEILKVIKDTLKTRLKEKVQQLRDDLRF